MFHLEWRGLDLSRYVVAASTSIEEAIAERPIASTQLRIPAGVLLNATPNLLIDGINLLVDGSATNLLVVDPDRVQPTDFDEVTIDFPHRPYRAEALRLGPLAYWRLDEGASALAVDSQGAVSLDYLTGNTTRHRAYVGEASAVTAGAAVEFGHTQGAGLSGALPSTIGATFTVAGFVRIESPISGSRRVIDAGPGLRMTIDGSLDLELQVGTALLTAGPLDADVWHHVAVIRTPAKFELWIDGVRRGTGVTPGGAATIDGVTFELARAQGGQPVNLSLDEWGIWSSEIGIVDLESRRRHFRHFGGYIYGITDTTDSGPANSHVLDINLAGYGLRLDHTFIRQIYASPSGSSVRSIVADVLRLGALEGVFNADGVVLQDAVPRAVYPVTSVMDILRELASLHAAIPIVDEWRTINMVRRADVEHTDLLLVGGRGGNVSTFGKTTEPRFFASRAIVVGRGEEGIFDQEIIANGFSRSWDFTHQPRTVLALTLNDVDQSYKDPGDEWIVDIEGARLSLAAGTPTPAAGDVIGLRFSAEKAIVVTADNQAAIDSVGFPIARKFEEDSIDTPALARVQAAAFLDRHDQPYENFEALTVPGAIHRIRPATAPRLLFPRYELQNHRLLVSKVTTTMVRAGRNYHAVRHAISMPAQDYQGDAADYWRETRAAKPPSPRPTVSTAIDPDQIILRPGNVAVPARLPIDLGGSPAILLTDTAWSIPAGANLVRVSGQQLAFPMQVTFMGRCLPRPGVPLLAGERLEVQLWDHTAAVAIGSAVGITTTVAGRGVLRQIALPLKEFDLTYRVRIVGGFRGAAAWTIGLDLDLG